MVEDSSRSPATLREKAGKCRRLAQGIMDASAVEQLLLFAAELETQAQRLEANIQAAETHGTIGRLALSELKHTSARAKEAVRRAREHHSRRKNAAPVER
jgi:hypothetical protein